jgi:hypothetical protein
MRIFGGNKITGGTASRAEVYGLFVAAVVLIGGGGAFAYSASGGFEAVPTPVSSETATPSGAPSETATPSAEPSATDEPAAGSTNDESNTGSNPVCESAYWDTIRAERQAEVDWLQLEVDFYVPIVTHNQDQLAALRNGLPTEPVRIQVDNDVFELSGTELEAFLEFRLLEASERHGYWEARLNPAIAALNSVPTC